MTNEYKEIGDYFESLATAYIPIGHTEQDPRFFKNTYDSIPQSLAAGNIMYLSDIEMIFQEQDGSNIVMPTVKVSVLQNVEKGNYANYNTVIESTYNHCKEIAAKMKADRLDSENQYRCILFSFSLDDLRLIAEGFMKDGWMGCTLQFPLTIPEEFTITPASWQ